MNRAILLAATLSCACGGKIVGNADAGGDGGADVTVAGDGGVTACTAPGGLRLCGAQCGDPCPRQSDGYGCQSDWPPGGDGGALGLCEEKDSDIVVAGMAGGNCGQCTDGHVCVIDTTNAISPLFDAGDVFEIMICANPGFAEMYALSGRLDLARYPDRSAYTGASLPTPGDCPSVPGIQLCGGACGGCPSGYKCVGRSPLHPYSLCVNDWSNPPPNTPYDCRRNTKDCTGITPNIDVYRCLTFQVDDASQSIADSHSFCVDKAACLAAAQGYPGGAFCTGGP